eukprot:4471346-Amphidinium_carterae.1
MSLSTCCKLGELLSSSPYDYQQDAALRRTLRRKLRVMDLQMLQSECWNDLHLYQGIRRPRTPWHGSLSARAGQQASQPMQETDFVQTGDLTIVTDARFFRGLPTHAARRKEVS